MVDALRAAHRRVKRGGAVIDARPDAGRAPRVIVAGRVRGTLEQSTDADSRDARADAAIERATREGLFRPTGDRGVVWMTTSFHDLAELDEYLDDSRRYEGYGRGTRRALIPFRHGSISVRRAIKFEVLERI